MVHNFSTPDNVIVVRTASSPNYIVSSYLPPYDTLEQDLTPMDSFLNAIKPAKMIWGLDANSKHGMWFSPTTDARGRNLVEFLSLNGLLTVNEKDGPTYSGPTGDSWIDITVTTINSAHSIQNWKVSEDVTLSDHNLIVFDLIWTNSTRNHTSHKKICHASRKMEFV